MKLPERSGLVLIGLLAFVGHPSASGQTGTSIGSLPYAGPPTSIQETTVATVVIGNTGNDIAVALAANWSQVGNYTCGLSGNKLTAADQSGNCDQPVTEYAFGVAGGTLNQNHTLQLKIQCASPVVASVKLDGAGFVTLVLGLNVFVSGPDTITIGYAFPAITTPSMGASELVPLAALLSVAGLLLLRRSARPAPG